MSAGVAVVTGATSGIGRETVRVLAADGLRVLGVGRSAERCREAERELRRWSGNAEVEILVADLSSLEEVRRLAAEILGRTQAVDVLVNNAGLFTLSRTVTVDGIETQLAVNWLAAFALTGLLLEPLRRAGSARVVNISSGSHYAGRMHWDDLGLCRGYRGLKAYDQSKLAMVLFTAELARRLHGPDAPAAFAVDPGLVKTDIGSKGTNALARLVWKLRKGRGISAGEAAQSVAWCALDPLAARRSGCYWKERRVEIPSALARDPVSARRLWEMGERMSGVRYPLVSLHAAHP